MFTFALILIAMIGITVRASLTQNIWETWPDYSANPWAVATLWDAYFGFTIFWIWVAVRETTWKARIGWLVLIYGLGNMATALYVLIQLAILPPNEPVTRILLPKSKPGGRLELATP